MILSFDTIKYIEFYKILQFVQVVITIGPNGQRYDSVAGNGFQTVVAGFLPEPGGVHAGKFTSHTTTYLSER